MRPMTNPTIGPVVRVSGTEVDGPSVVDNPGVTPETDESGRQSPGGDTRTFSIVSPMSEVANHPWSRAMLPTAIFVLISSTEYGPSTCLVV